jgi:hypothetical protein
MAPRVIAEVFFAAWFVALVAYQFARLRPRLERLDRLFLFSDWKLFTAPVREFHVLYRDVHANGSRDEWREVPATRTTHRFAHALFNPSGLVCWSVGARIAWGLSRLPAGASGSEALVRDPELASVRGYVMSLPRSAGTVRRQLKIAVDEGLLAENAHSDVLESEDMPFE